ncbi:MAG: hypothetical protein KJO82_14375, partial [Gammaproteobacteria bacterium]|nr:hypothetical protein [Gammaproteobacteria bacterium]
MTTIDNISSFARVRPSSAGAPGLKPFQSLDSSARSDLLLARSHLLRVFQALETLADLADIKTRFKLDLPDARSTAPLGLDLSSTAARLSSAEEINASPRSFTPFGPAWTDGSSALLTIGGEYDGSHGSGPITLEVRRAGTHGVDDLRIRVEDSAGVRIRNINIRDHHDPDRQYDLRNGLYLTLGPGDLINRDLATIQVFDSVGSVVNPDNPLGGIRNSNPNLQFGLPAVVDGSFAVNGESIAVSTSDTVHDVIDRINTSAAGVTASFNATTERIDFVQDTNGSVPDISLQSDSSNFLQAVKLDTATVTPGIDPESQQVLSAVAQFSSVQSGDLLINGTRIAIDSATDSLEDALANINASAADVTASFDELSQRVVIRANESDSVLQIDGNGTGFFSALSIPEGRVDPDAASNGISRRRSYDIADALGAVVEELNVLFRDASFDSRGSLAGVF